MGSARAARDGLGVTGDVLDLRDEARRAAPPLPWLPHLADAARATWLGRMVNEHASAAVFEALAGQLADARLDVDSVRACAGFADEERRHGVLCGAVVEALGGEARAVLPARPAFPEHAEVVPLERALRNVLSVSCLSETVAVALIGAERADMPEGPLRALLSGIWADEIGHARFGWALAGAHVPSLDTAARARLGDYLAVAFAHLVDHELSHLPEAAALPGGEALGLCSGSDARALFFETVRDVIVPGLGALGLDAARAWRRGQQILSERSCLGNGLASPPRAR
jgi:hypothetical protein